MPPNDPPAGRLSGSNAALLCACALTFVFLLLGLFGPIRPSPLPVSAFAPLDPAAPAISGSGFAPNGVYPTTRPPAIRGALPLFGSWLQSDASTGRAATSWYPAAPAFDIFVAGYPDHPGNALYAEVDTGAAAPARVPILFYDTPGELWRLTHVSLDALSGATRFRIVAADGSTSLGGWLGFSAPFAIHRDTPDLLRQMFLVFLTAVAAPLLLLAPGLLLRQKRPLPWIWIPFIGLLALALVGLAAWVAPSLKPTWIAKGALAPLLLYAAWRFWRLPLSRYTDRLERRSLLIVALLIAVATAKATYSIGLAGELFRGTISRTLEVGGVSDSRLSFHVIQLIAYRQKPFGDFGRNLYRSYGVWNFSHRGALASLAAAPILLAGPVKVQPLMPSRNWTVFDPEGFAAYRILMISLAACSLLSVFGLARSLLPDRWAFLAFLVAASAPFTVHEIYFTWPKLEDAAFVLLAAWLVLRGRYFAAGCAAGLGYLCHPSALLAVPSLAGIAILLPGAPVRLPAKLSLWAKRLAAMAAGLVVWLVVWWLVNRRHFSQAEFLRYIPNSDGLPSLSFAHWLKDRFDLACNTLIPLWVFLFHSRRPGLNAVDAPSPAIVHFNFQYWDALPFGAGLLYFFGLLRQFFLSWSRARPALLLVFVVPLLIYTVYWGGDNTGMLRTGLHPWFLGLMVASVVVWRRFQARSQRFAKFARWALLARALGLLFILFGAPILSQHAIVQSRFALSDISCLAVMLAGALALCAYTFRWAEQISETP